MALVAIDAAVSVNAHCTRDSCDDRTPGRRRSGPDVEPYQAIRRGNR